METIELVKKLSILSEALGKLHPNFMEAGQVSEEMLTTGLHRRQSGLYSRGFRNESGFSKGDSQEHNFWRPSALAKAASATGLEGLS